MGKILRFNTIQAIKSAAAKVEARQHSVRTQSRRNVRSFTKPHKRTARWNPLGTSIFNIGMLAFVAFWFAPDYLNFPAPASLLSSSRTDTESASFGFCHSGGGTNCVVDGDTIWYRGNKIRIADIDTPETYPPRCASEAQLGEAATNKLHSLLNAGAFSIERIDRDTDRFGRQLRILTRGGNSIGGMLVDEGLARWYEGGRQPWC